VYSPATAGGAAGRGLLPTEPAVYARRRISGTWLADWDRRGRRVWAPRERAHGAGRDALDPRWCPGRARPTGRAAEWPLGCVLAVSPPTTAPATVRHVRPSTSLGRSSSTGVGGLSNPLSTNFGHTQTIAARVCRWPSQPCGRRARQNGAISGRAQTPASLYASVPGETGCGTACVTPCGPRTRWPAVFRGAC
jgi:hypothetical protein